MEFREGNEHLVETPEGFEIGDLVEVERHVESPTGLKKTKWIGTIEEIAGEPDEGLCYTDYHILPVGASETLGVREIHMTLITRPLNVTNISDEELEAHIASLHDLTYRPVITKKKAKKSSVKGTKAPSMEAKARKAVKTGRVSGRDLDTLLAKMQEVVDKREGEQ